MTYTAYVIQLTHIRCIFKSIQDSLGLYKTSILTVTEHFGQGSIG